ncbi:MAG: type I-C CRISPR-associated protein Cas5c [Thermomicrobiales bacterium]
MGQPHIRLRTWADFACFTRPEFKVERSSYPMITPSAARGILEAVFWKPEIRYEIRRIGVVKPGRPMVIVRNELAERQSQLPIQIDEKRQQRSSLILRDVEYLIEADIVLQPHATVPIAKYLDQARRRIERGQYFHTPYMGTREFAANFEPADDQVPIQRDVPMGTMLFDIAFIPSDSRSELDFWSAGSETPVSGYAQALFAQDVRLESGWWTIPANKYQELYRLERGDV